jgi:hypothetical protein
MPVDFDRKGTAESVRQFRCHEMEGAGGTRPDEQLLPRIVVGERNRQRREGVGPVVLT